MITEVLRMWMSGGYPVHIADAVTFENLASRPYAANPCNLFAGIHSTMFNKYFQGSHCWSSISRQRHTEGIFIFPIKYKDCWKLGAHTVLNYI